MMGNNPAIAEMMKGVDMSPEAMKSQFDAIGVSPDQVCNLCSAAAPSVHPSLALLVSVSDHSSFV